MASGRIGASAVAILLSTTVLACSATTATPRPPATPGVDATPTPAGPAAISSPNAVVSRFDLAKTFTSPSMGYAVDVAADWTIVPATTAWTGLTDNGDTAVDAIAATGTDSTVTIASQPLPPGTTWAAWLGQFHVQVVAGEPSGCDGGDPSTWPTVPIGPETGTWEQLCNAAVAFAQVGGRIYVFAWESDTFNGDQHLRPAEFKAMLETVAFDPGAAVDRPGTSGSSAP